MAKWIAGAEPCGECQTVSAASNEEDREWSGGRRAVRGRHEAIYVRSRVLICTLFPTFQVKPLSWD